MQTHTRLFIFVYMFTILNASSVVAQKYTAKKYITRSNTDTVAQSFDCKDEKCTMQDLKKINQFTRKINRKMEKVLGTIYETEAETDREAKKRTQERTRALKFFSSDEYNQMIFVYKRCGKKIPKYQAQKPFWVLDETENNVNTCQSCLGK